MVNIRPSTLRQLREKQHAQISPLHVSIARLSYMRDHAQQQLTEQQKETLELTTWAKNHIVKKCQH